MMRQPKKQPPKVRLSTSFERSDRVADVGEGRVLVVPLTVHCEPIEPDPDYPSLELEVDVDGSGKVVVTAVRLQASAEVPINSDALRSWSISTLVEQSVVPHVWVDDADSVTLSDDHTSRGKEIIVTAVRRRNAVGDGRLSEVAALYEGGGIGTVEGKLAVSRSQAYRLVKQAREAGHLPSDGRA